MSCSLVTSSGARYPITGHGLVIGRSARCDLVIEGSSISRVQAIFHLDADGPFVNVVGSAPTALNGRAITAERVRAGDTLTIGDHVFTVAAEPQPATQAAWMLRDGAGQLYGVLRADFTIGGGEATVIVDGWPRRVATLHPGECLALEAVEPVVVNGTPLDAGELVTLAQGDAFEYQGTRFEVVVGGAAHAAGTLRQRGAPIRALLELLPRGGRLILGWSNDEQAVYLPERRCELVALLLQPPSPYRAGELVPDELLVARLGAARVQLNVLVRRVRTDLVRAGLDGMALIERPSGGGTRFVLDSAATAAVM